MSKPLIIVESPTKIKTLKKFLKDYTFDSSKGHIRDLPEKGMGVDLKTDLEGDFEPEYVELADKKDTIKALKSAAKKAGTVYLAPDPDREGEAIAWHIEQIMPKGVKCKRVTFNAITKSAVEEALANPRKVDLDLVNSQQARRLLDRIVGYTISPILTRRLLGGGRGKGKGASAGRVQSVALKLVVEREEEIDAFVTTEYWNIYSDLITDKGNFRATLSRIDDKRIVKTEEEKAEKKDTIRIPDEKSASALVKKLEKAKYQTTNVEKKEKKRNPVPPFITSTLQQEASRHYKFNATRTMSIAQQLYEGIELKGEGAVGLITYMRTDSTRVEPEALKSVRSFIKNEYGAKYLPESARMFKSKKSAQDAHEAIRPSDLRYTPKKLKSMLTIEQHRLYSLIWNRFVASQMNPAIYDTVGCDIETDQGLLLRAQGSTLKFKGFLAVYQEKEDENEEEESKALLPPLEEGQDLKLDKVVPEQSFTRPPPRYTEASLVKALEASGIGRPSTYATIMSKIQSREYTTKENGALKPTEYGRVANAMLCANFPTIMDIGFTSGMETALEEVEEHKREWHELMRAFWKDYKKEIEKAEKEAIVPAQKTDLICPECGGHLNKIWARGGYFYRCEKYVHEDKKSCQYKTNEDELKFNRDDYEPFDESEPCPKCGDKMLLRHGQMGAFLGCSKYPKCRGTISIRKKGAPTEDEMPECPAVGCDGRLREGKSRFGNFLSCTNYPECNVIASSLEKVMQKFEGQPKTAAPPKGSKGGGGRGKKKVSKELQAIVGEEEMSLKDARAKLWDYIKENKLQNPKDRREIIPDKNLEPVFGTKESTSMFKIAGILNKHLS